MHTVRYFNGGIGHIRRQQDGQFLVQFYGRRVAQATAATMAEARAVLRDLAATFTR